MRHAAAGMPRTGRCDLLGTWGLLVRKGSDMNAKKWLGWLGLAVVVLACLVGPAAACDIVEPAFPPMYNGLIDFCPGPALLDLDSGWEEVEFLVPDADGGLWKVVLPVYVGWDC